MPWNVCVGLELDGQGMWGILYTTVPATLLMTYTVYKDQYEKGSLSYTDIIELVSIIPKSKSSIATAGFSRAVLFAHMSGWKPFTKKPFRNSKSRIQILLYYGQLKH